MVSTENESNAESEMLVNSASANTISPGEIRKLMSAPDKSKSTSKKKQKSFSIDIILNGKTYRECGQHAT